MDWYWLLVAHLVGDYLLQSDWMALEKTKRSWPAIVHVSIYGLCFVPILGNKWLPVTFVVVTHFLIDRFRLARYVCWAKNFIAYPMEDGADEYIFHNGNAFKRPPFVGEIVESAGAHYRVLEPIQADGSLRTRPINRWWHPWAECVGTGYHKNRPPWLAVWLMIIADNTLHLICNGIAFSYLRW